VRGSPPASKVACCVASIAGITIGTKPVSV
jgi:hypothetical protein